MKVVINNQHGGFSLSGKAEKEYLKLKGKRAFFYTQTKYKHRDNKEEWQRVDDSGEENAFMLHTVTKDLGKTTEKICGGKLDQFYFSGREIKRDDKDLIKVVEKFGEEAAGDAASLKIVEIPDGVDWEIGEYDGWEHIAEKHRTWS